LEFRDIYRVSGAITAERMKTDSYCQRRNCSPLNALFSDDIARCSSAVGRQTTVGWRKQVFTHTAVVRLPGVS